MKTYLLGILADNKPGVLTHIMGLFSRRGFNVDSMSVGVTENPEISRFSVAVSVDSAQELYQVMTNVSRLIDVIKVVNLSDFDSVERELVMIKVKADRAIRSDIVEIVDIFRAQIVDVSRDDVVVELTGTKDKIDAIIEMLSEYEILEIVRTGAIGLTRGPVPLKNM